MYIIYIYIKNILFLIYILIMDIDLKIHNIEQWVMEPPSELSKDYRPSQTEKNKKIIITLNM